MVIKKKTYPLTIYLIKESFLEILDIVEDGLEKREINNYSIFFYKRSNSNSPEWLKLFEGHSFPLFSSSASGLFITKIKNRLFALAFGPQGRYFMKKGVVEERFGLITTLNSVKEKSIRSIDTKTLETEGLQTRIQSAHPVSADIFGFDVEKDLLRSVVGESEDKKLGKTLAGKDSLRVSLKCDLSDLDEFLATFLVNYKKSDYKEKFPWIDNLKEINDHFVINDLEKKLLNELNKKSPENLWLTIPEILEWSNHGGFKYSKRKKDEILDDLHVSVFKEDFKKEQITLEDLKNSQIHHFDQDNTYTKERWMTYECIYFEYSENDKTYFLTGGKWYAVNSNLVKDVNEYYKTIPQETSSISFIDYNHEDEEHYNKELANSNIALCLDRKNIQIEGRSNFEFCDVYTKNKQIIHIKRYSGSSVLSHLFNQGYVSANFLLDPKFRRKINDSLLVDDFKIKNVNKRPNIDGEIYEVIFAIISNTKSNLNIPFFSRLTLAHVTRSLINLGFKVSLVKVKNLKNIKGKKIK